MPLSRTLTYSLVLILFTFIAGSTSSRIVNGTNASNGEFPYAVSIRYLDAHTCGGSIIAPQWVLTAAHCVSLLVLYGTIYIKGEIDSTKSQTQSVLRGIIHKDYHGSSPYLNDVALLQVKEAFEFSSFVQPVKLPLQGEATPRLENSVLIGWGHNATDGRAMSILQKVNITVFPDAICSLIFLGDYSRGSHICTGTVGGGKGQCNGDSGGALTIDGVIYGIVSWSKKPCATTPGVMTRVTSFIDWIHQNTNI